MTASKMDFLCDVLDNTRNLTKWYLRKVPEGQEGDRIACNDVKLNSPYWQVAHLIWTDFNIGMKPLGYKGAIPDWVQKVGFGSSGELPEGIPGYKELLEYFNEVHQLKLEFLKSLDDEILEADYALSALGFKSNYFALLHLARHEGVHSGNIAVFCKLKGIKTI